MPCAVGTSAVWQFPRVFQWRECIFFEVKQIANKLPPKFSRVVLCRECIHACLVANEFAPQAKASFLIWIIPKCRKKSYSGYDFPMKNTMSLTIPCFCIHRYKRYFVRQLKKVRNRLQVTHMRAHLGCDTQNALAVLRRISLRQRSKTTRWSPISGLSTADAH